MKRYFIFFSYLGTNYRGLQTQLTDKTSLDFQTVQGVLEYAIKRVLRYPFGIGISSRTDAGVHALESSAHLDIPTDYLNVHSNLFPGPERLVVLLNRSLEKSETDIRVRRIVEVDPEFSIRSVLSRQYCYRLAVCKTKDYLNQNTAGAGITGALPIAELYRIELVRRPFDAEKVSAACSTFLGTWNFKTFMSTSSESKYMKEEQFMKTVKKISLSKRDPGHIQYFDPISNKFDFYEFHIESSGFLRKQVRRMVGALIAVGAGKITTEDILFMLKNPSPDNWHLKCIPASPNGLFLKSVIYKDLPIIRGSFS